MLRPKTYYANRKKQKKRIKGKAIIISNHNAVSGDFATMVFTFWRRTVRCLMAECLYEKNKLFTAFLKCLGGIRVDRYNGDFSFLSKSLEILNKGGVVGIFPEARIPKEGEEKPLEFKPSVVYLALESGAPIIPMYNEANYSFKKRNRFIIGEPVYVRDLYDESLSERDNLQKITSTLRDKVIGLKYELQRQEQKTKKR